MEYLTEVWACLNEVGRVVVVAILAGMALLAVGSVVHRVSENHWPSNPDELFEAFWYGFLTALCSAAAAVILYGLYDLISCLVCPGC